MVGEDPDADLASLETDYDGSATTLVDPSELQSLLDALDGKAGDNYPETSGERVDWAVEREAEITRLEKENEELRKILGIDPASLTANGIPLEMEYVEAGRYSTFLAAKRMSGHSHQGSGDGMGNPNRPFWENNSAQQQGGLQRPMELQPGMRVGLTTRRPGIFGGGQQRGGAAGGMGRGMGPPPPPGPLWGNQLGPSPQNVERQWPLQMGPALDISR